MHNRQQARKTTDYETITIPYPAPPCVPVRGRLRVARFAGGGASVFAMAGDSGSARCPAFRFNVAFAKAGVVEPPGVGAAAGVDADGVDAIVWLDPWPAFDGCDPLTCLDDSACAVF